MDIDRELKQLSRKAHDMRVFKTVNELEKRGYKVIILGVKNSVIPDAIAIHFERNKILAVEVEHRNKAYTEETYLSRAFDGLHCESVRPSDVREACQKLPRNEREALSKKIRQSRQERQMNYPKVWVALAIEDGAITLNIRRNQQTIIAVPTIIIRESWIIAQDTLNYLNTFPQVAFHVKESPSSAEIKISGQRSCHALLEEVYPHMSECENKEKARLLLDFIESRWKHRGGKNRRYSVKEKILIGRICEPGHRRKWINDWIKKKPKMQEIVKVSNFESS